MIQFFYFTAILFVGYIKGNPTESPVFNLTSSISSDTKVTTSTTAIKNAVTESSTFIPVDQDLIITVSVAGFLLLCLLIFIIAYFVRQATSEKYKPKRIPATTTTNNSTTTPGPENGHFNPFPPNAAAVKNSVPATAQKTRYIQKEHEKRAAPNRH
ncbi:uncharacterized protein LOC106050833 [Biomphalaria glabrata]|uniref:Uncharacterized protein LOC106050833 n=1 Tax=Biomphalaria glabrata TaxID=6526 RepID=A0A9W2YDB8_BIOGL|nr:uncharacterized protein LOC106050833 [Biomphalaria glabrata]